MSPSVIQYISKFKKRQNSIKFTTLSYKPNFPTKRVSDSWCTLGTRISIHSMHVNAILVTSKQKTTNRNCVTIKQFNYIFDHRVLHHAGGSRLADIFSMDRDMTFKCSKWWGLVNERMISDVITFWNKNRYYHM